MKYPHERPDWPENYLDIKWLSGGRDTVRGVDCWGLLRVVYIVEYGIALPEFAAPPGALASPATVETTIEDWREIIIPRPGDVVALGKLGQGFFHVGVYVDNAVPCILHITTNSRAHVATLRSLYKQGFALKKFYRHVKCPVS